MTEADGNINVRLDNWNYIFYSMELLAGIVFFPLSIALFYYIDKTRTFHLNFRGMICLINMIYVAAGIYRVGDIIAKFCQNTRNNSYFRIHFTELYVFYIRFSNFSWLVLMCDRIVACCWPNRYEETFSTKRSLFLITCGLLIMSLAAVIIGEHFSQVSDYLFVFLQPVFSAFDAVGIYAIHEHNKKQHDTRHERMISLSKKLHIKQNILASNYILAVTVVQLIISISYICFNLYLHSDMVPGKTFRDETTLWTHAIEGPLACYRTFFVAWLLWTNEKFRRSWNIGPANKVQDTVTTISAAYLTFQSKQWE